MTDPLLLFEDVTLRRGGRILFEELSLTVGAGEGLYLTGPNGSGKSSLLRLAAGLLREETGAIRRARLTLVDEALALDRDLPLRRALAFWSGISDTMDKLDGAMQAMDLGHLSDVPVRLLSTGQAKRASLVRAAASGASLWLLDEPLNGLDTASVERLHSLIESHRAAGGAVIVASHVPLGGGWTSLELGG